jgi:hypothetical protein
MIKLNSQLKKDHIRFFFSNRWDKTWIDLEESKYKCYIKKMSEILSENDYEMNETDANIRINRSKGSSQEFIYAEIQARGSDSKGSYCSFLMESENGKSFNLITVYDKDFDEIETIEV